MSQTEPAKHPTMGLPHVQGRCPACGWKSLFLGDGGYVTCSIAECPEPDAATTVLERPVSVARPGTVRRPAPPAEVIEDGRLLAEYFRTAAARVLAQRDRESGQTAACGPGAPSGDSSPTEPPTGRQAGAHGREEGKR